MKKPAAATTVGKPAQHAKPAAARSGRASAGGKGPKGGGSSKHTPARKHSPAKRKKRGLALGEGVACCSAEALAASLRLAGGTVSDDDVLALHWATGGTMDAGASILETLETAAAHGLAGVRPVTYEAVSLDDIHDQSLRLLLGVELPGPHALVAVGDGPWISWGELYDPAAFPDAIIEEAWVVAWL